MKNKNKRILISILIIFLNFISSYKIYSISSGGDWNIGYFSENLYIDNIPQGECIIYPKKLEYPFNENKKGIFLKFLNDPQEFIKIIGEKIKENEFLIAFEKMANNFYYKTIEGNICIFGEIKNKNEFYHFKLILNNKKFNEEQGNRLIKLINENMNKSQENFFLNYTYNENKINKKKKEKIRILYEVRYKNIKSIKIDEAVIDLNNKKQELLKLENELRKLLFHESNLNFEKDSLQGSLNDLKKEDLDLETKNKKYKNNLNKVVNNIKAEFNELKKLAPLRINDIDESEEAFFKGNKILYLENLDKIYPK